MNAAYLPIFSLYLEKTEYTSKVFVSCAVLFIILAHPSEARDWMESVSRALPYQCCRKSDTGDSPTVSENTKTIVDPTRLSIQPVRVGAKFQLTDVHLSTLQRQALSKRASHPHKTKTHFRSPDIFSRTGFTLASVIPDDLCHQFFTSSIAQCRELFPFFDRSGLNYSPNSFGSSVGCEKFALSFTIFLFIIIMGRLPERRFLHLLFFCVLMMRFVTCCDSCGPGRTGLKRTGPLKKYHNKPLREKQYVPSVDEFSYKASGPPEGKILRKQKFKFRNNLVYVDNPNVVFRDEERSGADRYMTRVSGTFSY